MTQSQELPSNVFRAGVGAVIINDRGKLLAFERSDAAGSWQMPQGGLNENEEPLDGVLREIREETGLTAADLQLLAECPQWLAYELPEAKRSGKYGRGQVQKWFLFKLTDSEANIETRRRAKPEFASWKWMTLAEVTSLTAPFRRPIYEELAKTLSRYFNKEARDD